MENPIEKEVERRKITTKRWSLPWKSISARDCHLVCNLCVIDGFNLVIEGDQNTINSESCSLYGHDNEYLHPPMYMNDSASNSQLSGSPPPSIIFAADLIGKSMPLPKGKLYDTRESMAIDLAIQTVIDDNTRLSPSSDSIIASMYAAAGLPRMFGHNMENVVARSMVEVDVGEERAKEKFKQPDEKEKSKFGTDVSAISGMKAEATKSKEKTCRFCLENEPTVILTGCGHMCLCPDCANIMAKEAGGEKVKCPVCKAPSPSIIRLYN